MDLIQSDLERLMWLCIGEAQKARTSMIYKPWVGAVVLSEDNKVLSRGHKRKIIGTSMIEHAERDAVNQLSPYATPHTLITTLEPCVQLNKSVRRRCVLQSCSDLIVEHNIQRVIYAVRDYSSIVQGQGVPQLKSAGIEVIQYDRLNGIISDMLL